MDNFLHLLLGKIVVLTTVAVITITAPFHLANPILVPTPSPVVNSSPSASTQPCHSLNDLPDSKCTPGAVNPNVTQDNIQNTICVSGYTTQIRPSTSYTNKLKV